MWVKFSDEKPPEGETVDTYKEQDGERTMQQKLKRKGSLMFFPDMSIYVYYTPTHWWKNPDVLAMNRKFERFTKTT